MRDKKRMALGHVLVEILLWKFFSHHSQILRWLKFNEAWNESVRCLLFTCSSIPPQSLPPGTSLGLQIWFSVNSEPTSIDRGRTNRFIWSRVGNLVSRPRTDGLSTPIRRYENHNDCVKQQNPQKRDRILTFSMSSGGGEARKSSRENYFYVSGCVDVQPSDAGAIEKRFRRHKSICVAELTTRNLQLKRSLKTTFWRTPRVLIALAVALKRKFSKNRVISDISR